MELCKLNNGLELPDIGYGTYPQKESLATNIPLAFRYGYRMIDASDNYHNEAFIGTGLQVNAEEQREMMVISKFSQPYRSAELEKCFEESRQKLGRVDVYLLHWPYPFLWKKQWRKMEKLYQEGKCRAIGVCNFDIPNMKKLLSFCKVRPMINQIERHPLFQQNEIADFCRENDIQIMCYSPVARMDDQLMKSPILLSLAEKYKKSVTQIVLRWNVEHRTIPIPAASSENHIRENANIFDFSLSQEEVRKIDSMECGKRIRFDPKKRFTYKQMFGFFKYRIKMVGK